MQRVGPRPATDFREAETGYVGEEVRCVIRPPIRGVGSDCRSKTNSSAEDWNENSRSIVI
jgi:hypothetical protein